MASENQEILRFEPGTMIAGRYEVCEGLGQGGMGAVLKVIDRTLDNEVVALKLLYPHLVKDPTTFARFRNEVLIARQLAHPNIVRLYDFGNAGMGYYYIVMEYVDGDNVTAQIYRPKHERITFEQSLRYLYDIATALSHAHKKGVVHRDLKPDNMLLTAEGDLKLTDFGLARSLYVDKGFTDTGEAVGTPYYMAPEQVRGERVDGRCDIYALGILAFELTVGKKPFEADCWFNLAAQHLMEPIPRFANKRNKIPKWFEEFVLICAAKDPEERFQTMDEVLEVLSENMDFGKSETRVPAVFKFYPGQARRRSRSSWWKNLLWIACGVLGGLGLAAGVIAHQDRSPLIGRGLKYLGVAEQVVAKSEVQPKRDLFETLAAGDLKATRELIAAGASIDLRDAQSRTPLFYAVKSGKVPAVEFLLGRGADINAQDAEGVTPAMFAAQRGDLEMLEVFVRRHADLDRHDFSGKSLMDVAAPEARDYLTALNGVKAITTQTAPQAAQSTAAAPPGSSVKMTTLRALGEPIASFVNDRSGTRMSSVEILVRNVGDEAAQNVEVFVQTPDGLEIKLQGLKEISRNTASRYYAQPDQLVSGRLKLKSRIICSNCR